MKTSLKMLVAPYRTSGHKKMEKPTDDQLFLIFIVSALVDNPNAVRVDRSIDEKGVLLELTVDPSDLGRVIGKNGMTAQSIRSLLRALGMRNDARYNLKIIESDGGIL